MGMKITPFEHTLQFTLRNKTDAGDLQNVFITFAYSGESPYVENLVRALMAGIDQYRHANFRGDGIYTFQGSKTFPGPAPQLENAFDPKKAERPPKRQPAHTRRTHERPNDEPRPAA
jgi:hypothetical protein